MLIDATHPEETRVVVVRGNRVEEFDYESAARKQLRGNIYLAKVARIEPSLQAAFVNYGGNRHGFLAFAEVHPDYYQIPVADREAMLREEAAERKARQRHEDADFDLSHKRRRRSSSRQSSSPASAIDVEDQDDHDHDDGEELEIIGGGSPDIGGEDEVEELEASPGESGGGASGLQNQEDEEDEGSSLEASFKDQGVQPLQAILPPVLYEEFAAALARGEMVRDEIPLPAGEDAPSADEPAAPAIEMEAGEALVAGPVLSGDIFLSEESESANPAHEGAEAAATEARQAEPEAENGHDRAEAGRDDGGKAGSSAEQPNGLVETVGSEDALEEVPQRSKRRWRHYKIQEVIKRNQIVLIQVVKEERGTKGAALTTYLSLAGRYTVLMPNTASGGGISRKITNPVDRKRLKEIAQELEVPEGMGLIIRTAGAARTKAEIKRDFEYLLRLWENVRDVTLKSTAPTLVYEEGDLIRRSIRDLYNKDIDEVLVAGDNAYREAKDFMRMLMPSHAKNVQLYKDPEPIFTKHEVERQLNQMFSPVVTLKSGGYIVLNQTEALVAIDVNSGRATREYSIEDTALKTNLEASEEIARQVRLRDLAGLIVIDFIDMDERRNNRSVERRLKECLRFDRARIQVGHISHFGLLEMSRQRLRQGVVEVSTVQCPMCQGVGTVRSTESVALMILRAIEDHLRTQGAATLTACCSVDAALYILNHKRPYLRDIENRYGVGLTVNADEKMHGAHFAIERGAEGHAPAHIPAEEPTAVHMDWAHHGAAEEGDEEEAGKADDPRRSRRRRKRHGHGRGEGSAEYASSSSHDAETADDEVEEIGGRGDGGGVVEVGGEAFGSKDEDEAEEPGAREARSSQAGDSADRHERRNRRRGRRGGRRRRFNETAEAGAQQPQRRSPEAAGMGEQPDVSFGSMETESETEARTAHPGAAEAAVPRTATDPVHAEEAPAEAQPAMSEAAQALAEEKQVEAPAEPAAEVRVEEKAEVKAEKPSEAPKLEVVPTPEIAQPKAEEPEPKPRPKRTAPARRGWWQRSLG
jgi:ribonuclease E